MIELVSFVIVGAVAALSYMALSLALIGLDTGLADWIVSAVCYGLFIVPVYLAHRWLSFRSNVPHATAFPRYLAVQASALVLAAVFSWLCYELVGMPTALAALVVIALTSAVNFVVLRFWAFARGR